LCHRVINITDALHDGKTAAEACCQCDGGFYDTPSSPEDDNDGDGASKNNGCSSTNATDATTDDGGTGEENENIHSVGEDTVSSKKRMAQM